MEQVNKKCNVCSSSNSKFLFYGRDRLHKVDNKLFGLEKCSDCGLVYLFPQPDADELVKYYPADYGPYHEGSQVLKYGPVSRILKKAFHKIGTLKSKLFSRKAVEGKPDTSVKRLLDFGCGNGAYLERMRKLHPSWKLFGFDNSEFALKETKAKGFEVWSGDLITTEIPDGYFDIVYLSHVIEHLNDPKAALKKIFNILKPGGKIIIITPNFDSIAEKVFGTYWFGLDTPRHLFLFTPKILSRLLTEVGFKVRDVSCVSDVRVALGSLNYLFSRKDMRINFVLWHFLRLILIPGGKILSKFKKTSIMSLQAEK
ncbi:MAG TPA: class I SAM-dependent methyltransferase [Candidatus Paceibacterota bacterium]